MAILPIMERKEVKVIMSELDNKPLTAFDLNNIIVLQRNICSTSTLYRRLTELVIASILDKTDKVYSITKYGRRIYSEFQEYHISIRERDILIKFSREKSFNEILNNTSISPNKLQFIINRLLDEKLIRETSTISSNKPGRPKKRYTMTEKGKVISENTKKLMRKANKK